jgi:hypothetical protein
VTDDLAERVRELCLTALGVELTAYLAGAESVEGFEASGIPDHEARHRLAVAADVIGIFSVYNRTAEVAPWLRAVDDASGLVRAQILRTFGGTGRLARAVRTAATDWARSAR